MRRWPDNPAALLLQATFLFLVMHVTGLLVAGLPYILNALITAVVVGGCFVWLQRNCYGHSFRLIIRHAGLRSTSLKGLYPGILLTVLLLLVYPLLGLLPGVKLQVANHALLNLAGLLLTAGLTEEMLFRGFMFGMLRRQWSFRSAALASALFFSGAHLFLFTYMAWPVALLSVLLAAAIAVPLAYLYEKGDRSIWSPALLHTCIRSIGLVITADKKGFSLLATCWIIACMLLPLLWLLFKKDFRVLWKKDRVEKNGIYHL